MTGDPLLRRIRHAEEWLGRARLDWRRGNAPAAMLRLMLAEAEIRHARETGADALAGGPVRSASPARWPRAAAAIAAAAVLAAGLGYASVRPEPSRNGRLSAPDGAARVGGSLSRTIVRLESGEFLNADRGRTLAGGPGDPGLAPRDGRPLQFAVPVDLRAPAPTF